MAKGHFYTLGFNSQWDIPSCRCWHILIWFWLMSPIHDLAFFLVQTELKKSQLLLTNGHFYTSGHSILLPLTPSYLFLIDVLPAPATPVQPPPSYKSVAGIAMLELWCYWENTKQIHAHVWFKITSFPIEDPDTYEISHNFVMFEKVRNSFAKIKQVSITFKVRF